jgi:effector-binding domain-containing protein
MPTRSPFADSTCFMIAMFLMAGGTLATTVAAMAQASIVPGGSASPATGPVQSAPLAPPPGMVAPAVPVEVKPAEIKPAEVKTAEPPAATAIQTPSPPAIAAPPVTATPPSLIDPNSTLAGKPGDSVNVDDLTLVARTAAISTGRATWDDGPKTLAATFARMAADAEKAGVKVAGRPVAIFVETDDTAFRYEAYLPIDRIPEGRDLMGAETRFGQTPAGRALRFSHKGPYDDVDSTYEAITAYLDAKGITVRDAFIEEYVGELKDSAEANFEVNIYVQPR